MDEQLDISTVKDTEVYQSRNTPDDIDAGLEPNLWYFIDETYGYVGPYESSDEAKAALLRYNQYI